MHERAKAYLLTGEFELALKDYTQVIKYQPNNSHAYFGRAFTHKALKDFYHAAEDFDKARELEPANPKLIVNYKQVYEIRFIKIAEPGEEMR